MTDALVDWQAVALVGATGTGKSALALEVAQDLGCCIISCDSMQLYRGLDIGTAKASAAEKKLVPHHLIDCADIQQVWSAQRWADAALALIKDENAQGRKPIIVGGTGMYLRALLEGFAKIPDEKEGVREHFENLKNQHGTVYLHDLLSQCDAELAERLHSTDSQRIMRGLCVFESTGQALSVWQKQQSQQQDNIDCPVFLLDVERAILRERLALRINKMLQSGWLDEVIALDKQQVSELHPALRAVGYRQLLAHIHGECSLEQAVTDAITATRKYAKRQVTWFRNQTPNAIVGDASMLKQQMIKRLQTWI